MTKHLIVSVGLVGLVGLGGLMPSQDSSAEDTGPIDQTTYFDSVWSGLGFVLGYGDRNAYIKYACNGADPGSGKECDGPPSAGLIGTVAGLADKVIAATSFKTCDEIPTSGDKDVTVKDPGSGSDIAAKLTFSAPNQSIPSGWTGGGAKFDRRFTFSVGANEPIKFVVEMSCKFKKTALFAANQIANATNAPGFERHINVFLGEKDSLTVGDLYISEVKPSTGKIRGVYAFNVAIDESTKKYSVVGGIRTGDHPTNYANEGLDIINLRGNYKEHTASLKVKRFMAAKGGSNQDTYFNVDDLVALAGADDAVISDQIDFALLQARDKNPGTIGGQGCMDFDVPTTAPAANVACAGLDYLTTAPAPVIDGSGKFSAKWILQTATSKLVEIPAL